MTRKIRKTGVRIVTDSLMPRRFIHVISASTIKMIASLYGNAAGAKFSTASAPDAIEIAIVST